MSETILTDGQLERLADMLAERLEAARAPAERAPASKDTLTAAQVAERLSVSARWVYDHASELHAIRLGDGPRARLRFRLESVDAAMSRYGSSRSQADNPQQQAKSESVPQRRRRRLPNGLPRAGSVLAVRPRSQEL